MKSSRWRNGWRRRRRSEIGSRDHAPGGMPCRFLFRWRCVFVDEIFGLTPSTGLSPLRGLAVAGLSQRLRALLMNSAATRLELSTRTSAISSTEPWRHGEILDRRVGFFSLCDFLLCGEEFQIYGRKTRFGGTFVQQLPLFQAFLSLRLSQIRKTAPIVATIISEISPPEE